MRARRRHRERLTGIVLAILGVVVLVVAVIALNAPGSTNTTAAQRSSSAASKTSSLASPSASASASKSTSTPTKSTSSGPSLSLGASSDGNGSSSAAKSVPLVVLNNTTTNGLATQAADDFRGGGWKVTKIGNLQNTIISTCAYYDPNVSGAEKAAEALRKQFSGIKRVSEKFSELPSGPIVVVLTSDYSSN